MKKIITLIILVAVLTLGAVFIWQMFGKNEVENDNLNDISVNEPLVVVEIVPEVHIKSLTSNATYEISEEETVYIKNENLVKLEYLNNIDRFVYDYDIENNKMILVYEDQTLVFDFNDNTYLLNGIESMNNDMIVKKSDTLYLSLEHFSQMFNMTFFLIEDPLFSLKIDLNSTGEASYDVKDNMDDLLADLPEKLNMTWEAVYSARTKVENLYEMPGLNIISPVWYDLVDGTGKINSKKQDDYMAWAMTNGYALWPAITNGFDPDMTRELISDMTNRTELIDKLVTIYDNNGFPGINIDFENIYKDDKDKLSQFIAELTAAFHRKGMLVSIDVTFSGGSDNWSRCYDRTVLGQWVDFIVVMSYDEHWGSSPISGSVASINWLDKNLAILLTEVESDKVIMGIPLYMRIWFERPHKEKVNAMKVTSDAITMHKMEAILASGSYNVLWDEAAGQNYISFIDPGDNAVKKIWIEDAESLKVKLEMVHKYKLKGIASWRRGYELQSIWPLLDEALRKSE